MDREPQNTSDRSRKREPLSLGLRCFLLLILILSVVVFASRMLDFYQLNEQKRQLEQEKEAYLEQIYKMEYYLDGELSYEDIIRIAREKYNLAFPDDTLIYSGQRD